MKLKNYKKEYWIGFAIWYSTTLKRIEIVIWNRGFRVNL